MSAKSAPVECLFSINGLIGKSRQSSIYPSKLNKISFQDESQAGSSRDTTRECEVLRATARERSTRQVGLEPEQSRFTKKKFVKEETCAEENIFIILKRSNERML